MNFYSPGRLTPSVLLIDDDVELCTLMIEFLEQHGFLLSVAYDGSSGLKRACEQQFDLILLDVMLPRLDGFGVLAQVRRRSDVPVIMLTARTEDTDRITGLDAGADDYLPKPFNPDELASRMRAILRRVGRGSTTNPELFGGSLRIDSSMRKAKVDNRDIGLTSLEFDLLLFLARSKGRVVSRNEVAVALHQRELNPFDRALDVHISHLRRKLGQYGDRIRTVRGEGYTFAIEPE